MHPLNARFTCVQSLFRHISSKQLDTSLGGLHGLLTKDFLSCSSYIKRYWKKSLFDLLEKLRVTLDRVYGEGKVSLVDASLRWMYHHSKMDGSHGGEVNFFARTLSRCFQYHEAAKCSHVP